MTREISDDVVRLFAAVGRHDQIVSEIDTYFGGTIDLISLPGDTPTDLVREIRAIATPASGD